MVISRGTAPEQPVAHSSNMAKQIFTDFKFFLVKFLNFNEF